MGERGFWDEQERVAKLQEKKPVLTRLTESIPWELFRPLLEGTSKNPVPRYNQPMSLMSWSGPARCPFPSYGNS